MIGFLLVLLLVGDANGAGGKGSTGIIVSFYGGGTSEADLSAAASIVSSALAPLSPRSGAALAVEIDREFGESPKTMSNRELAGYPKTVQSLDEKLALGDGNATRQTRELEEMRRTLEENQATLALDPVAKTMYFAVLEVLARTYYESNATGKAQDCLADLAGTFPGQVLTGRSPKTLKQFYPVVKAKLAAAPAEILVEGMAKPPQSWRVYVNGREADWKTPAFRGDYRVFVTTPFGDSRVHVAVVREQASQIRIDVPFDVALTTEKSVGLRFENPEQQARFAEAYALTIAKRLGLSTIVLVSHGRWDGRTGLRLSAYSLGRPYHHEFVEAAAPKDVSEQKVRAMAASLLQKIGAEEKPAILLRPVAKPVEKVAAPNPVEKIASPAVASKPVEKNAPSKATTFEQAAQDAQDAYVYSEYDKAVGLGELAMKLARGEDQKEKALRTIVAARCQMGKIDLKEGSAMLRRLKPNSRGLIRYLCGQRGLKLPTDDQMGIKDEE